MTDETFEEESFWEDGWTNPANPANEPANKPEVANLGLLHRLGRAVGWLFQPAVGVAVLYVFLFALFLIEKDFDDERRDTLLDADRKIEDVLTEVQASSEQTEDNLRGILCLAQRVDILIDAELTGVNSLGDLSPEDLKLIRQSCEDLLGGEGGAQSGGD